MSVIGNDTLKTRRTLNVDGKSYDYFSLDAAATAAGLGDVSRLPFSLKILLENLVRLENGRTVTVDDIKALGAWVDTKSSDREIAFRPARVLMQDLTGVPAVVDLAAMRQAMVDLGGDPKKINPLSPVDLVIDHSVQIDNFGNAAAFAANVKTEFERNGERYRFLRWGQDSFENFRARAARHRHLPSGQSRIPVAGGVDHRRSRQDHRLSRHAGRHRQPHDDGQRPGRARLGRRRHRGRGGDARPAAVDADPRGRRHAPHRQVARRRDRDRSGADRDPDAAQARRRRQICRVFRPRHRRAGARRPRDDRQHGAGIRRDLRLLPDRRRDHPLPDLERARSGAGQAGRGLCQGAGHVARRVDPRPGVHRYARPRSRHGRAVAGRPAPAAGPGGAVRYRHGVRHRAAAPRARHHRGALAKGRRRRLPAA